MNKPLMMALSGIILSISSGMALAANPCPKNAPCQHGKQVQPQQQQQQQHQKQQVQNQGHGYRTVKVQSARLRSGPGTNYPVVKGLRKGDRVTVIREQGKWAQVQVGNAIFWIASSLLSPH